MGRIRSRRSDDRREHRSGQGEDRGTDRSDEARDSEGDPDGRHGQRQSAGAGHPPPGHAPELDGPDDARDVGVVEVDAGPGTSGAGSAEAKRRIGVHVARCGDDPLPVGQAVQHVGMARGRSRGVPCGDVRRCGDVLGGCCAAGRHQHGFDAQFGQSAHGHGRARAYVVGHRDGAKDAAVHFHADGRPETGRVVNAAVTDLDDDTATVIAAVEVTVRDGKDADAEPTVKRNRFSADLVRAGGTWKLESLQQVAVDLS